MKKKFVILIKGFLLGFVSLAIPGLSASTIALILSIYFEMVDSISNIFKNPKKSLLFLGYLMSGFVLGSLTGAFSVDLAYGRYPLVVCMVIWGFILGGIPQMVKDLLPYFKKISNWIVLVVVVTFLVLNSYLFKEAMQASFDKMGLVDYISLVIVGFITASTLVIPGIDFAVVLLSLGYYYPLVEVIANIFSASRFLFNLSILIPYLGGYLGGTFLFSKLIRSLYVKYEVKTRFAGLAFVLAAPSIVVKNCIVDNPAFHVSVGQFIVGGILSVLGFALLFYTSYIYPMKKKVNNSEERVG